MGLIPYFAYGELCDPRIIEAIVGSRPSSERGKILGYRLGIQRLHQTPPFVRQVLMRHWPLNFRAYALVAESGGAVDGTVWWLSADERARLARWSLVHEGWMRSTNGSAKLRSGERIRIETDVLCEEQRVDSYFDESDFTPLLNDVALTVAIAQTLRAS